MLDTIQAEEAQGESSPPALRPADPTWRTWHDNEGMRLVEENPENETRVYVDGEGKRHHVMRARGTVVLPHGPTNIRCTKPGCVATVLLTDPPSEDAKGWQLHPVLGARCRAHPWK